VSTWYHVVCLHKPPYGTYVCDIEDDGGAQGRGHDKLWEWRERERLSQPERNLGQRLRVYNIGGRHPELVRVTIAYDRNRNGHVWTMQCGICDMTVQASDASLLVALNRLRSTLPTISQELIADTVTDRGIEKVTTQIEARWTPLDKLIEARWTPLDKLQGEISN
jgi:hypothetical protein